MSTMARDVGAAPGVMARRMDAAQAAARLETAGGAILRYGLAAILLYFGAFKFHPVEAEAIRPLVSNSPLMGWMYAVLSVQAVSALIGTSEIVVAALLLARRWSPRASAIGGAGAIVIFLTTLSFLLTTPGAWAAVPGWPIPMPGAAGSFLIKDLFLLGAAVWITGESLRAMVETRRRS
jgi:reactive chlorine resistance protein C